MEVDVSRRNMKQIEDNVRCTVEEFNARDDVSTVFGEPVIAYLSTTHPLFDTFFARGENDHPKKIYRPGNTLILHYVPWDDSVATSNEQSQGSVDGATSKPSEEWLTADRESLRLAMEINKTIKMTLDKVGRIHSNTSSMVDWDMAKHRYGWSNKIAAFIGGIGTFGPAGSLHTPTGYGGRVGSILTAALYAEKANEISGENASNTADGGTALSGIIRPLSSELDSNRLEEIYERVIKDCRFKGSGAGPCSEEMIAACPGGAISADGIDRQKCQDWCETLDRYTPCPEICGKCFRYR